MGSAFDLDAFLSTFEGVAMEAGWDKRSWALRVASYLSGEAQVAYMTLSKEQAWDYYGLMEAILDKVGLSVEKYRQKFQAARWTGGVQPRAFA